MKILPILKGIKTYIPGLNRPSIVRNGTSSARYCYSVWLRHLVMSHKNSLSVQPNVIAELGPGYSIGTGLAALISGVNNYYAFDVVNCVDKKRNIEIFDELIKLFEKRQRIPDETEFPKLKPYLESYEFPTHILTNERLKEALKQDRIKCIRNLLSDYSDGDKYNIQISYFAPWYDSKVVKEGTVDMVLSQAVMQEVDDLKYTYEVLYRWLKPGGFMSHTIGFKSYGLADQWNIHWSYSDFAWKLVKGKRPYFINREPHSTHINIMRKQNLKIVCDIKTEDNSGIQKKSLASRFKNITDDDLTTSGAFIQAVK